MHLGAVCRFYRSRKGPLCHFLNLRLNEKPRDVHLYCALMACGDDMLTVEESLIICGLAGFFYEYVPGFLACKNVYKTMKLKWGAKIC